MGLSARDRSRYARQLLLPQLGEAGQERLLAARVRAGDADDPGALAVARTYLSRAGVEFGEQPDALELALPSPAEIERIAGRPELREAARALVGALAAVHALQRAAGLERPPMPTAIDVICSEEA